MKTKTLTSLAAISLVAILNTACASMCCGQKDISVQMYSARQDIKADYSKTVQALGKMGFTSVEAAGYSNGKFYGMAPEQFKKTIESNNMKVLSSHTSKRLSEKELESGDFTESLNWWKDAIKAHKAAGMEYICVPSMHNAQQLKTLKRLQVYCDYYNAIGKLCKENGIKFGYHNHKFEFEKIQGKVMYDYMLEHTNPEYVFFEMDVYWTVRGECSPVAYFNKYPKRFKLLHIKDDKELGQSGMVGFDAIFNNVDKAGTEHIIVEVERYNFKPLESIDKSIKYLQKSAFVPCKYNVAK